MTDARRVYAPPTDDDAPLDLVELAIVRALVPVIVKRIREELESEQAAREREQPASGQHAEQRCHTT